MGGVKNNHLKRDSAGDQYIGYRISRLSQFRKGFEISLLYFNFTSFESDIDQARLHNRMEEWFTVRLIKEGELGVSSTCIVWMCFAFICYHYTLLKRNVYEEYSFHASPFYKDISQEIRSIAHVIYPWDTTA